MDPLKWVISMAHSMGSMSQVSPKFRSGTKWTVWYVEPSMNTGGTPFVVGCSCNRWTFLFRSPDVDAFHPSLKFCGCTPKYPRDEEFYKVLSLTTRRLSRRTLCRMFLPSVYKHSEKLGEDHGFHTPPSLLPETLVLRPWTKDFRRGKIDRIKPKGLFKL